MTISDIEEEIVDRLSSFILLHLEELENKGYSRNEVVAIDFENEAVLFYMTCGDIVRVAKTQATFVSGDKNTKH